MGQPFQLKVGETLKASKDDLAVQFVQVKEDSRCPKNTNCMWEGQAVIELAFTGKVTQNVELIMSSGKSAKLDAQMGKIHCYLKKVDPYPEADKKIAEGDYVIEVVVE